MDLAAYFEKGITYTEYMTAFGHAVAAKRTSGPIQTEEMARYTELNFRRAGRIYKHTALLPGWLDTLRGPGRKLHAVCLTEFWCGDAAQNLPVVELGAVHGTRLSVRYLFRDENPELMDRYLTLGGRSIPLYILLDADSGKEAARWGPRPVAAQELLLGLKAEQKTKEDMMEAMQHWYHRDKTLSLQNEWNTLLSNI